MHDCSSGRPCTSCWPRIQAPARCPINPRYAFFKDKYNCMHSCTSVINLVSFSLMPQAKYFCLTREQKTFLLWPGPHEIRVWKPPTKSPAYTPDAHKLQYTECPQNVLVIELENFNINSCVCYYHVYQFGTSFMVKNCIVCVPLPPTWTSVPLQVTFCCFLLLLLTLSTHARRLR